MKTVTAYQCEKTDRIFKSAHEAQQSEFHAMMKYAAGHLPVFHIPGIGDASPYTVLELLASKLEMTANRGAFSALQGALAKIKAHQE